MDQLNNYLSAHNFKVNIGDRIVSSLRINPEKYYRILHKLKNKHQSYQISKVSHNYHSTSDYPLHSTEFIAISPALEDAKRIYNIAKNSDDVTPYLQKQSLNVQQQTINELHEIGLKIVRPAQYLEKIDQMTPLPKFVRLEEVHDSISVANNIFTLKRMLIADSQVSALTNSYVYDFYLTIRNTEYLPDIQTFLELLHNDADDMVRWSLRTLTDRFYVYSQIYNLYSKNEYMANLINDRINEMDETYARRLNGSTDVERMPIFSRVHTAIKTPVMNLEWSDLKSVLCHNSPFCITDKANGYQSQLYFDKNGEGMFTGFGNVEYLFTTGDDYRHPTTSDGAPKNCLFDGEMVKTKDGKRLYLIFDCFFWNNESQLDYPLFSRDFDCRDRCRYNIERFTQLCSYLNSLGSGISFDFKKYYWTSNCQGQIKLCQDIYTRPRSYNLDGLIFTNYNLTVPEMLENRYNTLGGARSSPSFRWKPIKYLSIDTFVRIKRDIEFPLMPDLSGSNVVLYSRNPHNYKTLDKLAETHTATMMTVEGDPIYDETVVEFVFEVPDKWIPLRGREEKTKMMLYDRSDKIATITKTGASEEALFDYKCSEASECPTLGYRKVEISSTYFMDNPYKTFVKDHYLKSAIDFNGLVKFNVLYYYLGLNGRFLPNYLDLACGRANDYYIWKDNVNFYLGIDIDPENISTAKNVARTTKLGRKYQFITGDLLDRNLSRQINTVTQDYFNQPKKYNIISMQFALHYLANDVRNLDHVFQMCSDLLYRDGYFIFTTFDGAEIHKMLQNRLSMTAKSKMGDILWNLEKKYPDEQPLQNAGQDIHFTMQSLMGFRPSHEFLVNYGYIIQRLQMFGFLLEETSLFSDIVDNEQLYWEYANQIRQNASGQRYRNIDYQDLLRQMRSEPHLYKLAQLYRYAVFRKTGGHSLSP